MHRDAGQSRAEAIRSAIREISKPLVGSTITPIVVFLPLISITGVTGVFFRALAITVAMALLTSLFLALTWTPTLSHYFIRQRRAVAESDAPSRARARFHGPRCCGSTSACCGRRWRIPSMLTLLILALVGGSYFCYQALGSDLLPPDGRGRLHPGLHHARRLLARRNQQGVSSKSSHSEARFPRSRAPPGGRASSWAWRR